MKTILFIAVMLCATRASMGQTLIDKSKRMLQIEKKFAIEMLIVESKDDMKFWIFKSAYKQGAFGFVPVMVHAEATDKEVASAIIASMACASFYDESIKKAAQAHQPSEQSPMIFQ